MTQNYGTTICRLDTERIKSDSPIFNPLPKSCTMSTFLKEEIQKLRNWHVKGVINRSKYD